MKVYYVEVSGGEWEEHYCYNDKFYKSKEKAEERKQELENKLAKLIKLEKIANDCDRENATDDQCEKCMVCENSFCKVYDNEKYTVEEVEVLD